VAGGLDLYILVRAVPDANQTFNDIAFRRAFSMAMDRQAMVDIAGYGYPTLNEYPSGLGAAFHSWNNPEVDKASMDLMNSLMVKDGLLTAPADTSKLIQQ